MNSESDLSLERNRTKNCCLFSCFQKRNCLQCCCPCFIKTKNYNDFDGVGLKENISNNKTWKYFKNLKVYQEKRRKRNK